MAHLQQDIRKGGKKVLLIEKGVWPRDKVCGDAVGGTLSHVKNLGVKSKLEMTPHFRVTGIKFSPKGNTVRVALPEEDVERMELILITKNSI